MAKLVSQQNGELPSCGIFPHLWPVGLAINDNEELPTSIRRKINSHVLEGSFWCWFANHVFFDIG